MARGSPDAATPEVAWPITVTARWSDPGYSPREQRWGLGLAAGLAWMGLAGGIAGGPLNPGLVGAAVVVLAILTWRRLRGQTMAVDLRLDPERLRIRPGADARWIELRRDRAGVLASAERGLDWRERQVGLGDRKGALAVLVPARIAEVAIVADPIVDAAWWAATMPEGTTPGDPPRALPVASLLGAWWPDPEARTSIRGNLRARVAWKEPALRDVATWDRRQRRLNGAILLVAAFAVAGVSWATAAAVAPGELLAYMPPVVVAALAGAWVVFGPTAGAPSRPTDGGAGAGDPPEG